MLVLSRKPGQELIIGDNIRIVVNRISGNRVSIGIEAPSDVSIVRGEIKEIRDEFADMPTPQLDFVAELDSSDSLTY